MKFLHALLLLMLVVHRCAADTWRSEVTGTDLTLTLFPTPETARPVPAILYLTNLSAPRAGTESDASIIAGFRHEGYLVAAIDYAHHPAATLPGIARDFVKLRAELQRKIFLPDRSIDPARIFIVPSGCRLKRDLVFYRDDGGPGRALAMDIIYPSQPARLVGAVLEFSCDNTNRMGNFSLDFCTDTLLPLAAMAGHAAAMADHPVAAPYQGFDPMPDVAKKIKAAARTLRAASAELPLNGRIVSAGFSRGSGMALMLATTEERAELEGYGENQNVSSAVQGAIVMSGRFTYLDLLATDKMIPRYVAAWGSRETQLDQWRNHGALDFLAGPLAYPLFLTINATESPDALHQMGVLRARLTQLGSNFVYHPESTPRGHKMPLAPEVLVACLRYLDRQLAVASSSTKASHSLP